MPLLSKLVAIVLTFAFSANAQCAAFCFSPDTSTKAVHPCCDDKKPSGKANCANKVAISDYMLVKSVSHPQIPQFAATSSITSLAPSLFAFLTPTVRLSADLPDPPRSITIRRI